MSVRFHATGHPTILSTHPTTIEITKDAHLSTRGNCIVAVNASMGPSDLPQALREILSKPGSKARLTLLVDGLNFVVEGRGDARLTLSHPSDFVIRRSGFVSDRTLMVYADKSARDLPPEIVRLLRDLDQKVTVMISAEAPE
ncbi:MAG TPA: DUF371 domain-containing protein [Candidatus Dormibacteraeota bacterium]|jgi:hypothetical protein|nr:DUF371 domain-containing protein [Candidatus Dormibacteraeota bacterium]